MSAFKKLKSTDAFVTTYVAKKSWNITGSSFDSYNIQSIGILSSSDEYEYLNPAFNYGPAESGITNQGDYNQKIAYRSINQLYYKNYNKHNGSILDPYFYNLATGSNSAPIFNYTSSKLFENYEQSTLTYVEGVHPSGSRYLRDYGIVYSLPRTIIGTHIEPTTLKLNPGVNIGLYYNSTASIVDDGDGVLLLSESNSVTNVGNVIYTHGIAIITDTKVAQKFRNEPLLESIEFKSNQPIYTYNYHCKISDYEYNHTLNPTALSGSDNKLRNNVSGSDFNPYITSIGLYNDAQELIAIGKLSQPLRKPSDTELTIQIKLDI